MVLALAKWSNVRGKSAGFVSFNPLITSYAIHEILFFVGIFGRSCGVLVKVPVMYPGGEWAAFTQLLTLLERLWH